MLYLSYIFVASSIFFFLKLRHTFTFGEKQEKNRKSDKTRNIEIKNLIKKKKRVLAARKIHFLILTNIKRFSHEIFETCEIISRYDFMELSISLESQLTLEF